MLAEPKTKSSITMQINTNLATLATKLSVPKIETDWRHISITTITDLGSADAQSLSFLEYPDLRPQLWRQRLRAFHSSAARAILVPSSQQLDYQGSAVLLPVPDVNVALQKSIDLLYPEPELRSYWHPSASVAADADIGADVELGAHVVIGAGCRVADSCVIKAGCVIGANCSIGAGSILHPRVVIYDNCQLGSNCILHSGVVIGADGFGFSNYGGRWVKKRHIGEVILGDDVEIGANSCVDRATYGKTTVADGCKIDNLVQIGHNVQLGAHSLACAQAGVAGSARVGSGCIIAGKAGVMDNSSMPDKSTVKAANIFIKASKRSQLIYRLVQDRQQRDIN